MPKTIEISKIEELEKDKIYHINLAEGADEQLLNGFYLALKRLELKALVTIGDVNVELISDMISKLPGDKQELILKAIRGKVEINPIEHEQTK